ncbi:hypothetical protein [Psychrobacter halodurans]|uniref:DNA polymerase III subunit psi n=1 Tax=Psychrobacter halodurans TaxID=2818439 RepID=A0AAW4IM25_9GAMM|nr:hypothetical protein [Psychrobacter halodurans]MBO1516484.1 hypothetical protein [Psychrobacter halodurans]
MSDIQDPQIVLQRRVQQRQILAMMGIDQWVRPDAATLSMADIPVISESQSNLSSPSVSLASSQRSPVSDVSDSDAAWNTQSPVNDRHPHRVDDGSSNHLDTSDTSSYHDDAYLDGEPALPTVAQVVAPLIDAVKTTAPAPSTIHASADKYADESNKKVLPFSLQGGRYGNWVILVDMQTLSGDSQKLWQNITQALSMTCETTSFPICAGMDTAELANASLAGYVFKIGRSEGVQVAALTALPDGLTHPALTTLPTLDEMLADSRLKRQFWQQIAKSVS